MIWILANWKLSIVAAMSAILVAGLAFITLDRDRWHNRAAKAETALAQVKVAQTVAEAAARKAIADTEVRYKEHADASQADYADAIATARTDADRYSAAHRVSACPGSAPRRTVASPQGGSPDVPADLSASTIVGDADVRACSGAAAYALAAHDWAVGLGSIATPATPPAPTAAVSR